MGEGSDGFVALEDAFHAADQALRSLTRERDEWKARAEEVCTITRDQLWRVLAAHDPGDDELAVSRVGTVTDAVWALLRRGQDVQEVERQPSVSRDEVAGRLRHALNVFDTSDDGLLHVADCVLTLWVTETVQADLIVSRDEIAGLVTAWLDESQDPNEDEIVDAVYALVQGDDPAVFVVRESDLPVAERDGEMFAAGGWGYTPTARASLDEEIECKTEALTSLLAIRRAIDTGQAVDPVEAKAIELCAVAYPEHEWGNAPWDVAEHYEGVEAAFRRLAAHLLGQEASDA